MSERQALIADRYRLLYRVGSGGMGVVWEALDERLERHVAVKQLRRQSDASTAEAELANKRAMREARLTARLQHPNAVPVFDAVEQDGQLWLIMQFVPSITLAAVLQEGGPLQPNEASQVGAQVASALAAAHAVGIVHRDVKPGNILITDDGTALISDFGIARALGDATLTTSGMVHGTPAYLAPEVARGNEANFASDVFSLGATLYGAMEGTPPFGTDENSIALLHRVASGQFPPPQHCGPLTPLILEMLSPDPDARPSMRAVADNLTRLAARARSSATVEALTPTVSEEASTGAAVIPSLAETDSLTAPRPAADTAPAPDSLAQSPTRPRRNRGIAAAVAIIAVIAVGILIAALLPNDRRAADPASVPTQSTTAAPASTKISTPPPQSPTPKASSAQRRSASPPANPQTRARTQAPAPSPTTAPRVRGTPTSAQLRRAITSYYALMPRNTDAAWPRMTASYQTNHAGGRQAYQRFWDAVDRISVADVRGIRPRSAQATLTYYFKDGRVVRERTAYGLVNEGGRLKINSTTVLSSVTL
ncbi:MAG TPA: protein kinase [Propionibacteriaceae bacterium]|nr:protein kinase [Propionibacteriaceae bacterium]